ncbi:cytochrome b [Neptunomonas phycophila]|uniref:cytochrome b n=1 Tax=Neptunomonas phycophila TaxID=1572645 RepID=UPI0023F648ED|nr:cytochrome b [Neptunomonas phycophila]
MPMVNTLTNQTDTYGWGAIALHWIVALAVIGMYPLGWYIDTLTYYDPEYRTIPHIHKSIGLILAAVVGIRIVWRLVNKTPSAIATHSPLVRLGAHAAHIALYALILTVLASGYLISTADGRGIEVFNWFMVPAIPELIEHQEDIAGSVHWYAATSLVILAGLHAVAALKHHFIDKDETLNRMLGKQETP